MKKENIYKYCSRDAEAEILKIRIVLNWSWACARAHVTILWEKAKYGRKYDNYENKITLFHLVTNLSLNGPKTPDN